MRAEGEPSRMMQAWSCNVSPTIGDAAASADKGIASATMGMTECVTPPC